VAGRTSQSFTVLSYDADASWQPSGEKATKEVPALCPSNVATQAPVCAFQSFTVLSTDTDASFSPLGEKATEVI